MIKINGTIKDIEGNIIENDIPICIEVKNSKNGKKHWYGSFKTSKTLMLSKSTEKCRIELEDGRSGDIIITHQFVPQTETEFIGTGALE